MKCIYIILQNTMNMDFRISNNYCPLPCIQIYKLNKHLRYHMFHTEKYIFNINSEQGSSTGIDMMYKLNNLYIKCIQYSNLVYFNDYYNNELNHHNKKEDINHISHLYMYYKSFGILNLKYYITSTSCICPYISFLTLTKGKAYQEKN